MQRANEDSFLEELSPLSEALVTINTFNASIARSGFYITIGTERCFKPFASKFFEGTGNVGLSGALDEIRGMETFRNVHFITFDNSDSMSFAERKEKFFFGKDNNIQVMWDYCILAKMEVEQSSEELDEGDHMHLDNFNIWAEFFSKYGTLPASQENEIMDLFKYFVGRDMLLLAEGVNNNVENTQLDNEEELEDMETESMLHDNVHTDSMSKCELWYLKFKASCGKEVYSLFELFKTDGVDMNKIDHLIMQKSKDFYLIQKKKGMAINIAGLLFTEEDSISG